MYIVGQTCHHKSDKWKRNPLKVQSKVHLTKGEFISVNSKLGQGA